MVNHQNWINEEHFILYSLQSHFGLHHYKMRKYSFIGISYSSFKVTIKDISLQESYYLDFQSLLAKSVFHL
jgi:hypothetical protein